MFGFAYGFVRGFVTVFGLFVLLLVALARWGASLLQVNCNKAPL